MPRGLSDELREDVGSLSAVAPLLLLEIDHPDLPAPIRVVQDTQDLTHQGNVFVALGFSATLPDDLEGKLPSAELSVDNLSSDLMAWIEASGGAEGATARMILVRRADPDVVEWDVTLDLTNVAATQRLITGRLGFEDTLNRLGCNLTYRPDTAPGVF